MPYFICPNCKERSVDIDAREGFSQDAPACHSCGFGFLFELLDDYYPAPTTGFVACDREGRILALGRGVFELSGWSEADLLGADVVAAFGLSGFDEARNPVQLALEQEKAVTEQIVNLVQAARDERDYVGEQFLGWFLAEQREEVASMGNLLAVIDRAGTDNLLLVEDYLARGTPGAAAPSTPAPPAAGGAL